MPEFSKANRKRSRVVVVGAGFAGINAAKELKHAEVDVLLIDQNNYHTFQPLLYQVATAGLETGDIAHQVRDIFRRQKNFRFRQGTVTGVNWDAKEVELADGSAVPFDYLILGVGAIYNDFGVPGVKEHGFFLKSLTEATNIRSHVLRQFELASAHPELIERGALNFVIVGAGPTGVEMAGALTELFYHPLASDYPELDMTKAKVIVVEMTDKVLAPYSPKSRRYAAKRLEERGVELRMEDSVAEVREHEVVLKSGEVIPTDTLIWAAGIRAHPLVDRLDLELERGYRVKTEEDLSLPGKPYAFAAGDMNGHKDRKGQAWPQVAQVAIQQGDHAAEQILNDLKNSPRTKFDYFDKGNMAIIGRADGIAELSPVFLGLRLRGVLGWLGWLVIHLIYLPGFQNRYSSFASWTYNYFTYDRHVRIINYNEPSPGEVANRTGKLVTLEEAAMTEPQDVELGKGKRLVEA